MRRLVRDARGHVAYSRATTLSFWVEQNDMCLQASMEPASPFVATAESKAPVEAAAAVFASAARSVSGAPAALVPPRLCLLSATPLLPLST